MIIVDDSSEGRTQPSGVPAGQVNLPCGKTSNRIKITHCNAQRSTRAYMLSMPKDGIYQVLYVLERCPKCKSRVIQVGTFIKGVLAGKLKTIPLPMHDQFLKQALEPDLELMGRIVEFKKTLEGVKVEMIGQWQRKVKRGECADYVLSTEEDIKKFPPMTSTKFRALSRK
jgi:hypothetical protein